MDSGPFSTPQPADRRPATRQPEQSSRPPQPAAVEAPRPVSHHRGSAPSTRGGDGRRSRKGLVIAVIAVLVVIIVAVGGWFAWSSMQSKNVDSGINSNEYQAVFFTNGQVYLGKLSSYNSSYLRLTNAFVVVSPSSTTQSDLNSKNTSTDTSKTDTQLVKITNGILEPQDEMFVARNQVLFYENLKTDGKAAKLIQQYNN